MRKDRTLAAGWLALLTTTAVAGLVHCVGNDPVSAPTGADDAGTVAEGGSPDTDATSPPPPGDSGPPADTGPPVDTGTPACSLAKPFANALPFTRNGLTIAARRFRLSHDRATAYMSVAYADAGAGVNNVHAAPVTGGTVLGDFTQVYPLQTVLAGFALADTELGMVLGYNKLLYATSRATKADAFTLGNQLAVTLPVVPNATNEVLADPYVTGNGDLTSGRLFFARFVDSPQGQTWNIFDVAGTAASPVLVDIGDRTNLVYIARPVARDPQLLRFMGWGLADARTYETRRSGNTWSTPTATVVQGVTIQAGEALIPFDVSDDDCELVFGVGPSPDGPYTVYRARRPL